MKRDEQDPQGLMEAVVGTPLRPVLLAFATAGLLAACGNDNESDGGDPDAGTDATDTMTDDGGNTDTGTDVIETDTNTDTGVDAETDTGTDTGTDTSVDGGEDGGTDTDVIEWPDEAILFADEYRPDLTFVPFGGSNNDIAIDDSDAMEGDASLRINVPGDGYTGGALVASSPDDLSGYNAIGFWVKADIEATLNVAGVGNDSAGTAFQVERPNIPLTTQWEWHVVPLANPAVLTEVAGLFHFAEAEDTGGDGYTVWMDDIQYVFDDTIGQATGTFGAGAVTIAPDETVALTGFVADVPYGDETISVTPTALYFDWMSSNGAVASVALNGVITGLTEGSADITAMFAGQAANGTFTVNVSTAAIPGPAPIPDTPEDDVVATIFSDTYTPVTVDTYRADFSSADFSLADLDGNEAIRYGSLSFAGIETVGENSIDVTEATHVRFDVYSSSANTVRLKLVDFGADNGFGGGDDTEAELAWNLDSDPAFVQGEWNQFDVPLSRFESAGLANRDHLSQYIFSAADAGAVTVYIDNIYFYVGEEEPPPPGPGPAPAPDTPAEDVVASIYSNAYPGVAIDTFRTEWSVGSFSDAELAPGDFALVYTNLDFVGIEHTGDNSLDLTDATHVRFDVWSAEANSIRLNIRDYGANNVYDADGDDTEALIGWDSASDPAFTAGEWNTIDIPLSEFEAGGLTNRANVSQYVFSALEPGVATVYIDNFYFYDGSDTPPPTPGPAPAPDTPMDDVVAGIFTNAYPGVPLDTLRTDWSVADFRDEELAPGDFALVYSNLDFVGIEATGDNSLDLTAATHVRFDVWSADATTVRLLIRDFGENNVYDADGDDTEAQIAWSADTDPAFVPGEWNTFDVPLAAFEAGGMTNRANVSQFVFSAAEPGVPTVYIDNFYFYTGDEDPPPPLPAPAPTPDTPMGDVVASIYSNMYPSEPVDTLRTGWSAATFREVELAPGDTALEYSFLDFVGIEATGANQLDLTDATHVRFDVYSESATTVRLLLRDFGADTTFDGGDDSIGEIPFDADSIPAFIPGEWITIDVALSSYVDAGLANRANISQFVFSALPTAGATVFIDNFYFYTVD